MARKRAHSLWQSTKLLIILLLFAINVQAQEVSELYDAAKAHAKKGNYVDAVACYEEIFKLLPPGEDFDLDRINYARPYTDFLLSLGEFGKVEALLSNPIYKEDAILRLNLAAAYGYQEKPLEAISVYGALLNDDSLSPALRSKVYNNLGFIYFDIQLFSRAVEYFRKAGDNLKGADEAILNSNLALALAHTGEFDEALKLIKASLKFFSAKNPDYTRDYIRCQRKYAEILYLKGDFARSATEFRKYFNAEKNWLEQQLATAPKTTRLNLWNFEKPLLSKCFILENRDAEFLYQVAITRRLTSLFGMSDISQLQSLFKVTPKQISRALKESEAAIEFVTYTDLNGAEQYAAIVLLPNGKARFVKLFPTNFLYEPEQVGTNSIYNVIKRDNRDEKNALYTDTILANAVWEPILATFPKNTKSVYFAPEGIFHFWGIENMPFTGRENLQLHRLTSTASLIDRKNKKSQAAKSALMVGGMDYASLPEDSVKTEPNHEASELIFSKLGRNDVFKYLPGTRAEIDSIAIEMGNISPIYHIGEARMKSMMPGFDIIHIATHGYSLNLGIRKHFESLSDSTLIDQSLNASGIALSGANIAYNYPDREDGILSAREICDLDLSKVDFVVLSACQTAQGDISDEGAAGLVRGLKNAGVHTVMATLWSVNDNSTMLFMQEYYRLLGHGKTKYEAYVGAQDFLKAYSRTIPYYKFSRATLSRERDILYYTTTYDAPYFWAPFILIDDF